MIEARAGIEVELEDGEECRICDERIEPGQQVSACNGGHEHRACHDADLADRERSELLAG